MAQYYGYQTQSQANAELIAAAITEMGRAFGKSFQLLLEMKQEERKLPEKAMTRLETFMKLPPDKRETLLHDPSFRQNMMSVLEPDLESVFRKKRKAAEQRIALDQGATEKLLAFGQETALEKATREEKQQQARKETAQAGKAETEEKMAGLKYNLATGVETPSPMNLMATGIVNDPIAAALTSLIPKEQLRDIALAEKKQGPIYQQAQQQEWFKWGMNEGFSPALAMKYAMHISKGEWDQLPLKDPLTSKPVRGKAEQELALNLMNAQTSRMSMQNNLESSIVSATMNLSEKAAIPLEMSREVVMALRQGKPNPYPAANDYLMETATLDKITKQQAVEKNRIELMKSKSGIAEITASLREMIAANKAGWTGPGASGQMKSDIDKMIESLTTKTMEMYGIPREHVNTWRETISGVVGSVWNGAVKPTVAMADDLKNNMTNILGIGEMMPLGVGFGGVMIPKGQKKFSQEQEGVMKNLYKSLTSVLQDPNTSPENKKFIADYIRDKLEPIRNDPTKFYQLLGIPNPNAVATPDYSGIAGDIFGTRGQGTFGPTPQPPMGPDFVGPLE